MTMTGRELRSTVHTNGTLQLTLENVKYETPSADELIVRVEAAPINPSDLGLLLGMADVGSLRASGTTQHPVLTFDIPERFRASLKSRLGASLAVGNEGAGTVVAAGSESLDWVGRRVAVLGGAMYADLRRVRTSDAMPLPEGASAADGAALSINPLTALGFVETARNEGHRAIVHTAAASNLGLMLQRICLADGIPLVNIVRSPEQAELLRGVGAIHVLNSRDDDFRAKLVDAIVQTGATIAFDAIGGGTMGSTILQAMERAAVSRMTTYDRYGSDVFKHLYSYGGLDTSPATLDRMAFGFQWSMSGWLLTHFLQRSGRDVVAKLRKRVSEELTTTFATRYTRTLGLAEALDPVLLRAYERKATGEKYMIDPSKG